MTLAYRKHQYEEMRWLICLIAEMPVIDIDMKNI